LSEAKTRYQQQQYQHSIQLAAQQTNLQKQQYDVASLTSQLQDVETKLGELVAVKAPYSGRVRRVKILGQSDRILSAEITLDLRHEKAAQ
jgi:multidrug resistance efflux pump